ncbi:MAG: phosphoribosyl-AMP cyclohydrolase [Peptococcaceae bacterium]|nr:phosphoribosyl-AMP cyclohydrolase [Peptococcaceae bacterium]
MGDYVTANDFEQVAARIKWDKDGLLPVVVQDVVSRDVLMMAYMNRESLQRTLAEGRTCFFSRSRQELWLKGETSGHFQDVVDARLDCDGDCLLVGVRQTGVACHTGQFSCFHQVVPVAAVLPKTVGLSDESSDRSSDGSPDRLSDRSSDRSSDGSSGGSADRVSDGSPAVSAQAEAPVLGAVLAELAGIIAGRNRERPEGAYTTYLFEKGLDKILKKIGEEAAEVIIAAKNRSHAEIVYEVSDLFYHVLVLLEESGVSLNSVGEELLSRRR